MDSSNLMHSLVSCILLARRLPESLLLPEVPAASRVLVMPSPGCDNGVGLVFQALLSAKTAVPAVRLSSVPTDTGLR